MNFIIEPMSKNVKIIVLRTAGTNCDEETAAAFRNFGAVVDKAHIQQILKNKALLKNYHIIAIPGGFTYGDDIESGRILANELSEHLASELKGFIKEGKLIIGICNGFQVLVKTGILPGYAAQDKNDERGGNEDVTLTHNDSGRFEDRWTHLEISGNCVWTEKMKEKVYFPVAHAEGKFILKNNNILKELKKNNQVVFRYCSDAGGDPVYPENPNGSVNDIAGITDQTGRVLGLMPHPERHFFSYHHPYWTRLKRDGKYGDGAKIFENGVNYVKEKLLNA